MKGYTCTGMEPYVDYERLYLYRNGALCGLLKAIPVPEWSPMRTIKGYTCTGMEPYVDYERLYLYWNGALCGL